MHACVGSTDVDVLMLMSLSVCSLSVCSLYWSTQDKKSLKASEIVEVYKYDHQVAAHHVSAQEKKANKLESKIDKLTTGSLCVCVCVS